MARRPRYEDLPDLCTVSEVRAYLQISRNAVYDLVARGVIPSVRFGRLIRVPKVSLHQKHAQNKPQPTDATALDKIAVILNESAWEVTACVAIAAAVRSTGRVVHGVNVNEELARLKTIMDILRTHIKIEPK